MVHNDTLGIGSGLEEFKFYHWDYEQEITICAYRASHLSDNFAGSVSVEEGFRSCKNIRRWETALETLALLLGVPGNLMAAVTALSMERGTTSNYIFFLSVGDLFTLLARAATPMTSADSFELFKMTVGFVPNSMLVLIVFERFMAVRHPWKKKRWFTVNTGLLGIALILGLYILMFIIWSRIDIEVDTAGAFFALSLVLFMLSCPFIVVMNILTIKRLRHMTQLEGQRNVSLQFWSKVENSITYIIIIASAIFVLLNGPFFIATMLWFMFSTLWKGDPLLKITTVAFIMKFTYWLTFLHHALNFYIYILGTKRFRLQCIIIIKSWMPRVVKKVITPSMSQTMMGALSSTQPSRSNVSKNIESGTEMTSLMYRVHESASV